MKFAKKVWIVFIIGIGITLDFVLFL